MRALRTIWLVAGLFVLPSVGHSADQIKLTIYVGYESDFCPGGYVGAAPKCAPFTGNKLHDLIARERVRQHDTMTIPLSSIKWGDQIAYVQLTPALRSLARRARGVSQADPTRSLAALLVAEWLDGRAEEQSQRPFPMQYSSPDQKGLDDIITGSIANRRSFNHGSLRSLDPEERYPWSFARSGVRVIIYLR